VALVELPSVLVAMVLQDVVVVALADRVQVYQH
jgi:hypothetical protein